MPLKRTPINVDDDLVKELMHVSGVTRKREAIYLAISEFLRRKKIEGLLALEGKVHLDLDWRKLEEQELTAQAARERRWRGHR
ncbi:MAG: DUF2191 domain-containing protein [Candidatus Methylomirabilota bacterium]|nr:MAG: DUF2191 domain-containing protein [candidate division NC10 bacterium]